ncbi:MAG: fibronectin type III domain-containing protein [Candidatus Cloacimonetes bacterium]|nr:fibronectin type III domain-containing protein [Candidatus Cloacimonadota bacterium]
MSTKNKNSFSKDSYSQRGTRLTLLSGNISKYQAVLNLPADIYNWALTSHDEWSNTWVIAGVERGEQNVGFETFQRLLTELRDFYIKLKQILLSTIKYLDLGDEIIEEYGLHVPVSLKRSDLKNSVDQLKKTSEHLRAAGDPRVLSEEHVNLLVAKCEEMEASWHSAHKEKQESILAHKALRQLFKNDSIKLRYIYTVAQYNWGKFAPDLKLLGFSPATERRGHGQPDIPTNLTFSWKETVLTLIWDMTARTTSYNLAFSHEEGDWEELYQGEKNSCSCEPPAGRLSYKVRARNIHGYSDWSEILVLEKE